jgi:hypothetical protein
LSESYNRDDEEQRALYRESKYAERFVLSWLLEEGLICLADDNIYVHVYVDEKKRFLARFAMTTEGEV